MSLEMKDYRIEVRPLTEDEGGGYLAYIPDLPGCQGDGETHEEAIADLRLAFEAWVVTAKELGREIPSPGTIEQKPIAALIRFPRTLHAELTSLAKSEGVSFNSLVVSNMSRFVGEQSAAQFYAAKGAISVSEVAGFNVGTPTIVAVQGPLGTGYVPKTTATYHSTPMIYEDTSKATPYHWDVGMSHKSLGKHSMRRRAYSIKG